MSVLIKELVTCRTSSNQTLIDCVREAIKISMDEGCDVEFLFNDKLYKAVNKNLIATVVKELQ